MSHARKTPVSKNCIVCGSEYLQTGTTSKLCPRCRELRDAMDTSVDRLIAVYKAGLLDISPRGSSSESSKKIKTPAFVEIQCPYCGRIFRRPKDGASRYCNSCIQSGLYHVHEVTGKTNGWDRRQNAKTVIKADVTSPDGWRGQKCCASSH